MFHLEIFNRLHTLLANIRNSQFAKNFAVLSLGTIIAQVVPFLATFILSRLYIPEEMGEWGVFSSYASILIVIGTLRYDGAIVKANNDSDAYNLTYLSLFISFLYTFVLLVLVVVFSFFKVDVGLNWSALWMLPIYVLLLLVVQILTNLATYLREYKLISGNSIYRSLCQALSRFGLGFLKVNRQGMIIGAGIGGLITTFSLIKKLRIVRMGSLFNFRRSLELAKENKDFPRYDLPSNLLNAISSNCPPILLSLYFLDEVVGLFSMAQTLLFIPMSLFGYSISQLYYKDASEIYNKGESLSLLTRKLFLPMYYLGGLFMCFLIVCESWLFGLALGDKWVNVGRYVVMLSPWLLLVTAISPLSSIFYVKGRQRIAMNLNMIGMVTRVLSLLIGATLFSSSDISVMLFGLTSACIFIAQGYYILSLGELKLTKSDVLGLSILTVVFIILYLWKTVSYFIEI